MKTGYIFWGTFLISIGLIFLFNSFGGVFPDFFYIGKFWPLLIVLWGISLLKLNPKIKKILAGLSGLFLALLVASLMLNNWCWFRFDSKNQCNDYKYSAVKTGDMYLVHSHKMTDKIKNATLNIEDGGSVYYIGDTCSNLLEVYSENPRFDLLMNEEYDDSLNYLIKLSLSPHRKFIHWFNDSRTANVKLNPKVIWDMSFNVGASKIKADLSSYNISKLDINAGAASIEVKLGDLSDLTNIEIDAGASSIKILIPKTVGCEVNSDTGLSDVNLDGFQNNNGVHYTENFENAPKKVKVNISGGVSSFRIVRI